MGILGLRECEARSGPVFEKLTDKCSLGVFPAPAFVADFPPVAPEFHQCTHRVHLRNLGTTDKKSSHKIRHRKIPRKHYGLLSFCAPSHVSAILCNRLH